MLWLQILWSEFMNSYAYLKFSQNANAAKHHIPQLQISHQPNSAMHVRQESILTDKL